MTSNARILIGFVTAVLLSTTAHAAPQEWDFNVALDGQLIGKHVFTLSGDQNSRQLDSEADFTISLIGIAVYRYHHVAHEKWNRQCLAELTADTDHDGDLTHVTANGSSQNGKIQMTEGDDTNKPRQISWDGCLMTYAYWNPALLKQTRLLNPETGDIENVAIVRQPDIAVTSGGKQIQAAVWRVTGAHNPVDVLYAPDGTWIGLNATVKGGRVLSYRLP